MNVYHFLYSTHNVASFCKKYPKDDYVYFHFSKTTFPPTKVNKQGLKFPEHSSICLNRGKLSKLETGNANRGGPQPEFRTEAAAAKSLQSCLTLCDPIDGSPTGFPVPGILQARTLEWVAISFSNAWKWKVKVKSLSRVWLLATPWTATYQAPPSMGFSRQKYWSGVSLPSPPEQKTGY